MVRSASGEFRLSTSLFVLRVLDCIPHYHFRQQTAQDGHADLNWFTDRIHLQAHLVVILQDFVQVTEVSREATANTGNCTGAFRFLRQ